MLGNLGISEPSSDILENFHLRNLCSFIIESNYSNKCDPSQMLDRSDISTGCIDFIIFFLKIQIY